MRKTLLWMFSTLLFLTLPALAQHGGHASGGHSSGGGGFHGSQSHGSAQPQRGGEQRGGQARGEQREHHDLSSQRHEGYHYSGGGAARGYWRGDRYDHDYFRAHWGYDHRFYWGHCNWWDRASR